MTMKAGLTHLGVFIRKSLTRLMFFFFLISALQLAQLHEILHLAEKGESHASLVHTSTSEVLDVEKSKESSELEKTSPKPQELVKTLSASLLKFSSHLEPYVMSWKQLASLSYWGAPIDLFKEAQAARLDKASSCFYPAIPLTPLAFVYVIYGYVASFCLLFILRFLKNLIFKKSPKLEEIKEE